MSSPKVLNVNENTTQRIKEKLTQSEGKKSL